MHLPSSETLAMSEECKVWRCLERVEACSTATRLKISKEYRRPADKQINDIQKRFESDVRSRNWMYNCIHMHHFKMPAYRTGYLKDLHLHQRLILRPSVACNTP